MWIEQISLEGYGLFAGARTVEFTARGVNIVIGPNETGKSTLVSGLCAVLFGERPSVTVRVRSWHAAGDTGFRGVVQLRTRDGRSLRMTRDFAAETLTVTETSDGTERVVFSGRLTPGTRRGSVVQPYKTLLTEIVGFSSRTIFEQTLCMKQTMLPTVFAGELREIASGSARADYVDVRDRLLARCAEITRDRPPDSGQRSLTNPRTLELAVEKHRRTERAIDEAQQWADETAALEAERDRLTAALDDAYRTRETDDAQIEVARQYSHALERYVTARQLHADHLEQLRTVQSASREATSLEQELDREFGEFAEVSDDFLIALGEIEAIEQQVEECTVRINRLTEKLHEHRAGRRRSALAWFGSGGVAVLIGLTLLLTQASAATFYSVLSVGAVAGACGVGAFWWASRTIGGVRARRDAAIEQRHSIEARQSGMFERYRDVIRDRPADVVRARYREYRTKLNAYTRVLAQAQARVGEDRLKARVAELDAEHAAARTQLDEMRRQHPWTARWNEDRDAVNSFLDRTDRSAAERDRKIAAFETRLTQLDKDLAVKAATAPSDLAQLRESLGSLETEIGILRREREALYLACRVLDESIDEFSRTAVKRVCERASRLFGTFTGGRYTRVELDDRLEPRVDNAAQTGIEPDSLSAGACDQLYMALRIAFAETLAGREGLPLILDDPFANFDSTRLDGALRTLELIAKNRQVILLSHDSRVERIGTVVARFDPEVGPSPMPNG